jgi:hypothetical protein
MANIPVTDAVPIKEPFNEASIRIATTFCCPKAAH